MVKILGEREIYNAKQIADLSAILSGEGERKEEEAQMLRQVSFPFLSVNLFNSSFNSMCLVWKQHWGENEDSKQGF